MTTAKTYHLFALIAFLFCGSCSRLSTTVEAKNPKATKVAPASFVNRVWRVSASAPVSPSYLYVFLSDGTLLTTSPMAKASLDLWVYKNGNLTFVQGSVPFKVDVVKLEQSEFRVRVHGQDGPYELAMVPAEQPVFE